MLKGLYSKFITQLLFPLHERLKKHDTVAFKRALEQSQWLSTADIVHQQELRLQAFIAKIVANVPFYQALFTRLALTPNDIKTTADLAKLPFLDKPTIRENFADFKSMFT